MQIILVLFRNTFVAGDKVLMSAVFVLAGIRKWKLYSQDLSTRLDNAIYMVERKGAK